MSFQDDAGFGCAAFGHLASAFVDQELPRADQDRFATHLPGCSACQRLCAEYRALDVAAMAPVPRPTDADWQAAWAGIQRGVEADRAAAAASPAGTLLQLAAARAPRAAWVRPLLAAAAAAALVGLSLALSQAWAPSGRPDGVTVARQPRAATSPLAAGASPDALSVTCQAGWEAVVFIIGGDDPSTVVQCQPVEI